jgi:hypothetical protein
MNLPIGTSQGLPRWAGLAIAWGITFVCVGFGAYEWVNPGALSASGQTASLFSSARDFIGPRGVAVVHFALAVPAALIALSIQLHRKVGAMRANNSIGSGSPSVPAHVKR